MMIRNKSVVITSGFTDSYVPIEKALQRIGGIGGGVTQVTELPATGDGGKIYYNTTEKKYYTYTEENGWSELGSGGSDGPVYELKYQYNPCFTSTVFDGREIADLNYLDELTLLKVGTKIDTYFFNKLDDNTMFNFSAIEFGEVNYSALHLQLEQDFANYLATLGIDWDTVDRTTVGDIKYNTTIELFDYRDLLKMEMSYNPNEWLICKYTVDVEVSPDLEHDPNIKITGIIVSTEIISKGTIVYPKMHIKYIMQPKVLDIAVGTDETLTVNACDLAIDTLGISAGAINNFNNIGGGYSSRHELGTTGFAFYDYKRSGMRTSVSLTISESYGDILNSSIFDIPLFSSLNIVGRFIAGIDKITIILPQSVTPAGGNPDTGAGMVYEYHIMDGVFTLIPLFKN